MLAMLMFRGLAKGRARFACAVLGVAVATGALVFMTSLVATNRAQASRLAQRAAAPWSAWAVDAKVRQPDLLLRTVRLTVDYRPDGRVLQGPPMRALLAAAPDANPYGAVRLTQGRWVGADASGPEVVCVRDAMRRFGRGPAPELGSSVKFVGQAGTMTAKVVGYLEGGHLPPQFPTVFANRRAFEALSAERQGTVAFFREMPSGRMADGGILTAGSEQVVAAFRGDEQRRMDYATPLLLIAAFLTALSLLVNSLLLSVEANRATLATLRTIGLTRGGTVGFVTFESLCAAAVGWTLGALVAMGALALYVAADPSAFPVGVAFDFSRVGLTLAILPVVAFLAVLFVLAPALKVRAMEAAVRRPRRRRRGMAVTFACGFAAFVAVEVWGSSLMRAFIPSPEWPDAIVSILPGGVSAFDIEKVQSGVKGVRRIHELAPLQVNLEPLEELKGEGQGSKVKGQRSEVGGRRVAQYRNALLLGSDWLPEFRFVAGKRDAAEKAIREGDACVITAMMARARKLKLGDELKLDCGRGLRIGLTVVGIVDLNWHMVTSRGLVRGLNRMPVNTDGPVFVSFDTVEACDMRPAPMVKMTHLWLDYEPEFLREHGAFEAGRIVEAEITRRFGNPVESTVRLHARDEIADGTLAHGTDVIGQAARVPFVFLAILAIGFVAMLVAEADARRRELLILRVLGATKARLARTLALSAVRTALVGMVVGFPLGAFAGWLAARGTAATWPGLPHYLVIPWAVILEGALGALVFALVFAVPTALVLIRRETRR